MGLENSPVTLWGLNSSIESLSQCGQAAAGTKRVLTTQLTFSQQNKPVRLGCPALNTAAHLDPNLTHSLTF